MKLTRSSGILLHPTSFPGPDGIGDLGPQAYEWIDFLKTAGCAIWQVLPLGPTGYGDSPYQCFSAFAGNHYLVSPALLLDEGMLKIEDLADRPAFPADGIDYGAAITWKLTLLDRAFAHFKAEEARWADEFNAFCAENQNWLDDYALFMALKEAHNGCSWSDWEAPFKQREKKALEAFIAEHEDDIKRHQFRQWLFFRQWKTLKDYAHKNEITIIGDAPIFVSADSVDVWANPDLFYLDESGNPTVVAGVPPDYFSRTGQLWGNPLYRWTKHQETGFAWWISRIRATLKTCDMIRLDHFRGFSGYWEVPFGNPTAEFGRWVKAPGEAFLMAVAKSFDGDLPIIAEDLGEISQDVADLRDEFNLPGMRILQFAFDGDETNAFLPINYIPNTIAYTGTHDNDTTVGWFTSANDKEREYACRYLNTDGHEIAWDLIRAIWSSVAVYAIAPLQDFLSLGTEARQNMPSRAMGNWMYRFKTSDLTPDLAFRIQKMNRTYNRIPAVSSREPYRPDIQYQEAGK